MPRSPKRSEGMTAVLFATALLGCGAGERPDEEGEDAAQRVERSGDLWRLAVTVGDRTVQPPLTRDCAALGPGEAGAGEAPPHCRDVARPASIPVLEAVPGEELRITTGTGASTVSLTRPSGRGVRLAFADAEPVREERSEWRARLPAPGNAGDLVAVSVSPLRTDSGSLGFSFRVR